MTDDWTYWRAALAGRVPPELKIGVPECGYYRRQKRDGTYAPVAVFRDEDGDGSTHILDDGREIAADKVAEWCEGTFSRACKNPISYATWKTVIDGGRWPDAAPAMPERPNMDPDSWEGIKALLDDMREAADRMIASPFKTDIEAGSAATLVDDAAKLGRKAEEKRVEEKRPHDEAAKAVQAKWLPVLGVAAGIVSQVKRAHTVFLNAKRDQQIAEQRRQQEEAERLRKQAEAEEFEAAASGSQEAERAAAAKKAEAERIAREASAPISTKIAGAEGRSIALKRVYSAEIVDYDKALMALKDHKDMRELVLTLANRAAKAQIPLDGVKFIESNQAV